MSIKVENIDYVLFARYTKDGYKMWKMAYPILTMAKDKAKELETMGYQDIVIAHTEHKDYLVFYK